MPPSKHKSGFGFTKSKEGLAVEPKIRALRNDYAETKSREKELIDRFKGLAKDCEYECVFCYIPYCPLVNEKK